MKTTSYDASEFLDDAESQAELLTEALATGKAAVVAHALGTIARARGMSALQQISGLNRATLYGALSEEGNPTLDTVMRVLDGLKIELAAKPKAAKAA